MTATDRSGCDEVFSGGEASPCLKILMISARFAPFVGGTEIHTGEVAKGLAARGHAVTVATTDTDGVLRQVEEVDGVTILRVAAYPKRTDLYYAPGLKQIIAEGNWDIVHIQGYHTAVAPVALAAAAKAGIPTALTFHSGGHSSTVRNLIRPIQVGLMRKHLLNAELLIGVSKFEAGLFADRLGLPAERVAVIPNGVSTPAAPPAESQAPQSSAADLPEAIRDDQITILSMGRLVRYKGHHRIIKAMPKVIERFPTARLLILGQGSYQGNLERLIRRLGLEAYVTIDHVPSDERHRLHAIMEHASVAVLMSSYESHGMAAHEALSVGLPLVVMDSTALSELVAQGQAKAVPPKANHQEIAEIVSRTVSDVISGNQERIPSPNGRSWPSIVDRIEDEYLKALARSERTSREIAPAR